MNKSIEILLHDLSKFGLKISLKILVCFHCRFSKMQLLWKQFLQAKSETTKFFTVQTFLPCKSPLLGHCLGDSCRNFLMWINTWRNISFSNSKPNSEHGGFLQFACESLFCQQAGTQKYVLMSRFITTTWYTSSIFFHCLWLNSHWQYCNT